MWPLHSPKIPVLAVDTFLCSISNAVVWVLWIVKLDIRCCSNTTFCNIMQQVTPISKYNEKTNTTCKKSDKQQIYRFFLNLLRSQDTVLKTVKMTMSVVVNKFFLLLLSIDKFDSWRLRWSQCSFSQLLKILSKNLVVSYCAYVQSFLGTLTTVLWKIIQSKDTLLTLTQCGKLWHSPSQFEGVQTVFLKMKILWEHRKIIYVIFLWRQSRIGMVCHCGHHSSIFIVND